MSEVTLTIQVRLNLLGVTDYFESEDRAFKAVLKALSAVDRLQEIKFIRTDQVKNDSN